MESCFVFTGYIYSFNSGFEEKNSLLVEAEHVTNKI